MCSISRIACWPSRPAKRNESSIRSHEALDSPLCFGGTAALIDVFQRPRQILFRLGQRGIGLEPFVRVGEAGPVDDGLGELPHGGPDGERRGAV